MITHRYPCVEIVMWIDSEANVALVSKTTKKIVMQLPLEYKIVRTLKNSNTEWRRSRSLAFGICEAIKAIGFTNWPKPQVVLNGPDNKFCHMRIVSTTNSK